MMDLDALTAFLGWCSILNIGVMIASTVVITAFKQPIMKLHSKMFGVNQNDLPMLYFTYLGNYKIAIYILNFVPYITLKIMA